jgi:hypothetical protein
MTYEPSVLPNTFLIIYQTEQTGSCVIILVYSLCTFQQINNIVCIKFNPKVQLYAWDGILVTCGKPRHFTKKDGIAPKSSLFKDAGDSTFNQNLRQLTVFLFIAII